MKLARIVPLLVLIAAATAASAGEGARAAAATPAPAAFTGADAVRSAMDATADPCQDFYRYACGGWLDTTKLPADQSRWGRGFSEIAERNRQTLRAILEEAANGKTTDANKAKLGNYYGACMDEPTIEKAGTEPLKPLLAEIAKVTNADTAMSAAGKLHAASISVFFGIGVVADFKNPDVNIAYMAQGGLGLPDRDYYLKDDDKSKGLRAEYQAMVGRMLKLLGDSDEASKKHAADIVAFETKLATASRPRAELRDPDKTYNKLDFDGLQAKTPGLPWKNFFAAAGHPGIKPINVAVPEFYEALDKTVNGASPEVLQAYMRWHLARGTADLLPKAFQDEAFAFYGQKLSGQKEQQPRWKRCVQATDNALGEILGQEFIKRQFAGDSKTIALDLIHRIEDAFASNLPKLAWMDDATRKRANDKKKTLTNKIGYPDAWRDYSKLSIKKGSYFQAAMASRRFDFDFEAEKIGKPVDKKEWGMTPPTVNAYYNPLVNEMVFPAGILQPPFFDRSFPMAMNFGGIGMVMGHELSHGFDDQGRKFDPNGKLQEWWEPTVSAKFDERAACVDDLYSGYEVQPGVKLNGKLTLGENIADLGGIKQAYAAWKRYAADNTDAAAAAVEGLTNDQLFFVSFAQTWCSLQTPEIERMLATVDPHSHPKFRVIGPLSNLPAFAETFQCAAETPMNPKDRCEVW